MVVYLSLITFELSYMILIAAEIIVAGETFITTRLLEAMGATAVYMVSICASVLIILLVFFIVWYGRHLKIEQSKGEDHQN
jgi:hypothetical protein